MNQWWTVSIEGGGMSGDGSKVVLDEAFDASSFQFGGRISISNGAVLESRATQNFTPLVDAWHFNGSGLTINGKWLITTNPQVFSREVVANSVAGAGPTYNATIETVTDLTISALKEKEGVEVPPYNNVLWFSAGKVLEKLGAGLLDVQANSMSAGAGAGLIVTTGEFRFGSPTSTTYGLGNLAVTMADVASAVLNVNGKSVTIGSLAGGGTTGGNVTLGTGSLTISGTSSTVYGGVISGTDAAVVALTRSGTGQTELTGINSFVGKTSITGGKLIVAGDAPLGVAPGSLVADQLSINNGTLRARETFALDADRGITLAGTTATVEVDDLKTLTYAGAVAGTALTKTGNGILDLRTASLNHTGNTSIQVGTLQVGSMNSAGSATMDVGAYLFAGNIGAGALAQANLTVNGRVRNDGDMVFMDPFSPAAAGTVTLSGATATALSIGAVGIAKLGDILFTDPAGGATVTAGGQLTANGVSGHVTLSIGGTANVGSVSGAGSTTVGAGGALTALTGLPGTISQSAITLTSGATLNTSAGASGNVAVTGAGGLNVTSGSTLNAKGNLTVNTGTITAGGVVFNVGGTVSGHTAFNVNATATVGGVSGSGTTTVAKGITLGVASGASGNVSQDAIVLTAGTGVGDPGGTLDTTGGTVGNVSITGTGAASVGAYSTLKVKGVLTAADNVNVASTGTLQVGGAVQMAGKVLTTAGAAALNGGAELLTLSVTGGLLTGTGTFQGNATLTGGGVINLTDPANVTGTFGVTGGYWNGAGSVAGLATSSLNTFRIGGHLTADGGLNVTGGTIEAADANARITGSVNYTSASSSTFVGVIAGTGKTVTLNNAAATLTLSGINTFTGGTALAAGTLNVNNGGTPSGSAIGTGKLTLTGGAIGNSSVGSITIQTNNEQDWNGDFSFVGPQDLNLGTGAVTMGASRQVTVTTAALTVGGAIAGSGYSLTKLGTGTLVLAGASTYDGGTVLSDGTLQIGNGGASGSVAGDIVDNASLVFNRTGTLNFAGSISGSGTVEKKGTGTLVLAVGSTHTYSGVTTVSEGTLTVNGVLDDRSNAVSVTSATGTSTLSGCGTVSRPVTVGTNGVLSPGDGTSGTLRVKSLDMSGGGTFALTARGTGYGKIEVLGAGTANITDATLDVSGVTVAPSDPQTTLISIGQAVTGLFKDGAGDPLPEGAVVTILGKTYTITYQGGTSLHDVVLLRPSSAGGALFLIR